MSRRPAGIILVSILTLASGLFDLLGLVITHPGAGTERTLHLLAYSPFEFRHLSRFLTMIFGFGLCVTSIHLLRRKRRAFQAVLVLSALSIPLHLIRGRDREHAILSLVILVLLLATRKAFTVRSGLPHWRTLAPGIAIAFITAVGFGTAGFWFLNRPAFGVDFDVPAAVRGTLRILTFGSDPGMPPRTHHALWLIHALHVMSVTALIYVGLALYRPVIYRLRVRPHERERARAIRAAHGRTCLDFFKLWPDKSIFFSPSGRSFLGYRAAGAFAVALGDPVGPADDREQAVGSFLEFCAASDWRAAFHQTTEELLPVYQGFGLRELRIGENAIVDLPAFSLEGSQRKSLRGTIHQLERRGLRARLVEPPVPAAELRRAREVSDAWLTIEGRRERGFTLGLFEETYLASTPLFLIEDAEGTLQAFANLPPSWAPGEATIDLMRHRPGAPNGTMDFLFVRLFEECRRKGLTRFDLGMAPIWGTPVREGAPPEERAVHEFLQRMEFLFSYRGLRAYKAKFASTWEPRYTVYRRALDLPLLGIVLGRISTVRRPPR